MASISGTNLAAPIVPFTTDDFYPTHHAQYGKGGWREVATIQERDAIPDARLEKGMSVFVTGENKLYVLTALDLEADPQVKTWTLFESGRVDDVLVDDISVVTNKVASLGSMAGENKNDYVLGNNAITGATKTKITYDSKGLVTAGADLAESDIPSLHLSKISDITATAAEVNVLDGITASTTELNYTDGVTSNIQTQLDDKVAKTSSADKVYGTDSNGDQTTYDYNSFGKVDDVKVGTTSVVTNKIANLGTMAGETATNYYTKVSADGTFIKVNPTITGATKTKITYDAKGLVTAGDDLAESDIPSLHLSKISDVTATATELNYVDGVTSSIQTQLDGKQPTISDLSTIRSGASAGATAVQPGDNVSTLNNDAGYLTLATTPTEIEWATYGTTTYQQVVNWDSAGKVVLLSRVVSGITYVYRLSQISDISASFRCANGNIVMHAYVYAANNSWNTGQSTLQTILPAGTSGDVLTYTGTAGSVGSTTLATVATSGSYADLSNTPTIGDATLTIQKNGTAVDTFTANATVDKTINITVPTQASDVSALPDTTKYAASASLSINSSTYVITLQLKDQDGNNIGTAQTIDLPLESVVVSGSYDSSTKEVVLTLQDGSTIRFSVADLVSGLQSEITTTNKLDADLVDDSTSTNKFVTASDKTTWNAKQDAITGAATTITSSDLTASKALISNASGKVAASTVTSTELGYVSGVTSAIQTQIDSKQATLVSGTNIKTINSASILGSGNITIHEGTYDYDELNNRPQVNSITLSGNKTSSDLGLQDTLVSGTNIKTINNNSLLGSGNITIDSLPSQSGQSGKFLTTNGTAASWDEPVVAEFRVWGANE